MANRTGGWSVPEKAIRGYSCRAGCGRSNFFFCLYVLYPYVRRTFRLFLLRPRTSPTPPTSFIGFFVLSSTPHHFRLALLEANVVIIASALAPVSFLVFLSAGVVPSPRDGGIISRETTAENAATLSCGFWRFLEQKAGVLECARA